MRTTNLNQGWLCRDTAPNGGAASAFSQVYLDSAAWQAIPVPGDVNAMLVAAGRMPDPRVDDNARQCYWVTGRDWWYRLVFDTPLDSATCPCTDLCLDGVDGHADLYLNGERLGRLENAFRPYRFDVTNKLNRAAPNVLLIRFQSIDAVLGGPRQNEHSFGDGRRAWMRKPQFTFGWDWSLPLPSIGLAGGVWLEHYAGARLLDVSLQTFVSGRVDFALQVTTDARDAGYRVDLRVRGHGAEIVRRLERPGRVRSYTSLQIDQPRLWWPNGFGEPALYDYEVDLIVGGQVADRRVGRFGIRESRLIEEPFTAEAGPGRSFWLEINGRKIFCKGANWVPPEMWPATAAPEQYEFYLRKAAETNFNMLRVWGGGIYEREQFYDLCDKLGLMVWQDFMFASGGYPVDTLRAEIIAEAEYQIRRLRNRACVVLWCGCNEDVFSWSLPDEKASATADTGIFNEPGVGRRAVNRLRDDPQIYSMILRGLVSRDGRGAPYVESSPQSHDDFGNLPESGNSHLSCWKYALFQTGRAGAFNDQLLATGKPFALRDSGAHPEDFRGHFEQVCSFDSEFCIQGPCAAATLRRFLTPAHQWPPDDVWTFHLQRGHAQLPHHEQTLFIAGALFGEIDSLAKYVKYGQATHAEMMRAEFESARRDRPNNGGTMFWMYNDCWPTSNWSVLDYYRRPKPAYYAAKRACAPRLPIIFERGGRVEYFFSNDGAEACRAEVVFGQARLDGSGVWEKQALVEIAGGATVRFFALPRSDLALYPGDYLFIEARVDGEALPRVTYFPALWKDVPWPKPKVSCTLLEEEQGAEGWIGRLQVATDTYARFCHLALPETAEPFWLDDNFFDLVAGDSRVVTLRSARPIRLADVRVGHWHTDWP